MFSIFHLQLNACRQAGPDLLGNRPGHVQVLMIPVMILIFTGEFNFTLPEGLPQGVYPIRSTLLLNEELAGDQNHDLQLVMVVEQNQLGQMVASISATRNGV